MTDHVYKVVEIVGTSPDSVDAAIDNAISRASETLKHIDWFEVREIRGYVEDGAVGAFQVKMGIGFRILDPEELERE